MAGSTRHHRQEPVDVTNSMTGERTLRMVFKHDWITAESAPPLFALTHSHYGRHDSDASVSSNWGLSEQNTTAGSGRTASRRTSNARARFAACLRRARLVGMVMISPRVAA